MIFFGPKICGLTLIRVVLGMNASSPARTHRNGIDAERRRMEVGHGGIWKQPGRGDVPAERCEGPVYRTRQPGSNSTKPTFLEPAVAVGELLRPNVAFVYVSCAPTISVC